MSKKYLSDYLTDYLTRYLPLQIGASPNTIRSYRDAFIVFLRYCHDELNYHRLKTVGCCGLKTTFCD